MLLSKKSKLQQPKLQQFKSQTGKQHLYYITLDAIYHYSNQQLVKVAQVEDFYQASQAIFQSPCQLLLGADCYKIFVNPAQSSYSNQQFQKLYESQFALRFPHLDIKNYRLFHEEPLFEKPFAAIAIDQSWYSQLLNHIDRYNIKPITIQPLAHVVYQKQQNSENGYVKELKLETHFIHIDHVLQQISQKPLSSSFSDEDFLQWSAHP